MNFFRRKRQNGGFLQQIQREPAETPISNPLFVELQERYARYCTSYLVKYEEAREHFLLLCALPCVADVSFEKGTGALLIGTEHIYLKENRTGPERDIGKFIIRLDRHEKVVRFRNITRMIKSTSGSFMTHHPHIRADTGVICMPIGGDAMLTALGEGCLYRAVKYALAGLNTYTESGFPYSGLSLWPMKGSLNDS